MNTLLMLPHWIPNWRDPVEIFFFAATFYYISLWLQKDVQKNLLVHFYGFCIITFGTYFLALPTVSASLLLFSPAIALLFMIMHQEILQRNMVSLKNIVQPQNISHDWLTMLMRTSLTMLHDNKELIILIEQTDAISSYVKADYYINAPLSTDLLTFIVTHSHNPQKMLWVTSDGIIRGINASWKVSWHATDYPDNNAWIDDAIAYTSKHDTLILQSSPTQQHYTIVCNGAMHQELTVNQVHQLLRKKMNYSIPVTKKGYSYDVANKKNSVAQHLS